MYRTILTDEMVYIWCWWTKTWWRMCEQCGVRFTLIVRCFHLGFVQLSCLSITFSIPARISLMVFCAMSDCYYQYIICIPCIHWIAGWLAGCCCCLLRIQLIHHFTTIIIYVVNFYCNITSTMWRYRCFLSIYCLIFSRCGFIDTSILCACAIELSNHLLLLIRLVKCLFNTCSFFLFSVLSFAIWLTWCLCVLRHFHPHWDVKWVLFHLTTFYLLVTCTLCTAQSTIFQKLWAWRTFLSYLQHYYPG